ncbi:hypothetical protein D9611_006018 [Ephemerocybe angulata]|uniref:Integrase catalytic domain-containing protein n=1 Tax=Ephemerocybe angulata TaxID=980116 RepID=A0A8H5CGB0_9AGAR|nr:hypothetical protein D9611_006018 [Tulosesus angulatus]
MNHSLPLPEFLQQSARVLEDARFAVSSLPNIERTTAGHYIERLVTTRSILEGINDFTLLSEHEIQSCVNLIEEVLKPLQEFYNSPTPVDAPRQTTEATGNRGRPPVVLDLDRALALHNLGNTWEDVASAMGVGRTTLHDHFKRAGIPYARPPSTDISDDELDDVVSHLVLHHPFSGSAVIQGHLRSMDITIGILRVQECLRRVDSLGVALRTHAVIKRRVYSVRGSNALWHHDGNEKLKPWGFYVHGCVDGYSRMVIYLVCTNNKRSATVGDCFRKAVDIYGWPSRMRGDFGTENNEVERMMVRKWGVRHRAYLRGRSLNNIRIERLWRDVRKDSLEAFRRIFFHLEKLALLDPDSPIHLVCLYLVFQPRIQASLDRAGKAWNRHRVRTARSKTPLAMYELSRERAINAGYWTGDPGDGVEVVDEGYGEDGEANFLPPKDVLDDDPVAPRSDVFDTTEAEKEAGIFIVDDEEIAAARSALGSMDFSEDDGNFGIDIYCTAVTRLFATLLASDSNDG